ncbi:MAG: hypothetical protein ACFE9L_06835 [Candidatus Hodarchaeota archaeon]
MTHNNGKEEVFIEKIVQQTGKMTKEVSQTQTELKKILRYQDNIADPPEFIQPLTPLENCAKLCILSVKNNDLEALDLSPLKNCSQLSSLRLAGNSLKALDVLPLAECFNLQVLELDDFNWHVLDMETIPWPFYFKLNEFKRRAVSPYL